MPNNLVNLSTQMRDANTPGTNDVQPTPANEQSSNPSIDSTATPSSTLLVPNPTLPDRINNPSENTNTQNPSQSVTPSADHTATTTEKSNARESQKRSRPSKSNPNGTNAKESGPTGSDGSQRQYNQPNINDKDDIQIISESNKAERLRDEATAKFLEKALEAEGEGDKARSDMFYNLYAAAVTGGPVATKDTESISMFGATTDVELLLG
ncbi:hypothetical protein PGT21_032836 [Puccinia graminis f. sp. tritici]|uniref:Uncharacterized protein n=1 Tax=Puccinia graminis f. sp. tritici TaxID=56615 RepID=A0A5B0P371_PUCGR|nr:hypothetical protein PGTUg99_005953 [Puccinia graminis f. sp. tritici]KAA1094920.1 hypothetical protein PGT21_032836 [Puccinia graminis f. sp. tritici]